MTNMTSDARNEEAPVADRNGIPCPHHEIGSWGIFQVLHLLQTVGFPVALLSVRYG